MKNREEENLYAKFVVWKETAFCVFGGWISDDFLSDESWWILFTSVFVVFFYPKFSHAVAFILKTCMMANDRQVVYFRNSLTWYDEKASPFS